MAQKGKKHYIYQQCKLSLAMCAAGLFSRESGQDENPHFRLPLILVIRTGEKNPCGNYGHLLTW